MSDPSPWGGPPKRQQSSNRKPRWLWPVVIAVVLLLLFFLAQAARPGGLANVETSSLIYYLLLVALISGALVRLFHADAAQTAKAFAFWVLLGAVLVMGYSFRGEFALIGNRLMGELVPYQAQQEGDAVVLRMGDDGHFSTIVQINDVDVLFLVDTGATSIVLSKDDARRVGFDLSELSFGLPVSTANGRTMAAPVRLDRLQLGHIVRRNVRATVNQGALDQSLLGQDFLNNLSGYEVRDGRLYLYP